VITLIGLMELLLAAVGAQSGDLNGLSIGWLIGESLGMVFTLRLVYAVARNKGEFQMPASSIAPGAVEGESGRMVAPSTSS